MKYSFLIIIILILFINCKNKAKYNDLDRIEYYLGIDLKNRINNVNIFEYHTQDYLYPRDIYISFISEDPKYLIKKLDLLPSDARLNKDTARVQDYVLSKFHSNFWKMRSMTGSATIEDIEKHKLKWWKPDTSLSTVNYGGFYNEFSHQRIVNNKYKPSTGRLILQYSKTKVFIQINLKEGH